MEDSIPYRPNPLFQQNPEVPVEEPMQSVTEPPEPVAPGPGVVVFAPVEGFINPQPQQELHVRE